MLDAVRRPLGRTLAVLIKEFIQLARERTTFAMIIAIPLLQLILFGYAIDSDPHELPTAVLAHETSPETRAVLAAIDRTGYFRVAYAVSSEAEIDGLVHSGKVLFAIEIPAHFGRDARRGLSPEILVIADASDPAAIGNAVAALSGIAGGALAHVGPPLTGADAAPPFRFVVHRRYNPAIETSLNIVPGLTGTILTMTMVIFTALAVTREVERGTMENLLAMPVRPTEVMLGKIAPYVVIGGLQMAIILFLAWLLFDVPVEGSLGLLAALTTLFVLANLSVGYTFSTIATSQLQAMQMSIMFFLPSLLLSGFLFPFLGMPLWAQWIGEALPLTHYLRIVRGIMLKGAGFADLVRDVGALAAFTLAAMTLAVLRFRQTLD
ncbi:ABC transporter permease [Consotaella salsifontis]|uniref:ABC-2 type transport system permease protein n=1 Tax=Consotaella salsifontis TaxID=1365950 RepID=A0A1T4QQP1_9HYPH|nr:ABC transporter permease [Consotaella salsifontis]SKA06004.1 ABC-2 type transport system permease protein [Consotaella salsifontis]